MAGNPRGLSKSRQLVKCWLCGYFQVPFKWTANWNNPNKIIGKLVACRNLWFLEQRSQVPESPFLTWPQQHISEFYLVSHHCWSPTLWHVCEPVHGHQWTSCSCDLRSETMTPSSRVFCHISVIEIGALLFFCSSSSCATTAGSCKYTALHFFESPIHGRCKEFITFDIYFKSLC